MRIVTRLARTEFRVGEMHIEDGELVLSSHPDQALKVKAYIQPGDVKDVVRAAMKLEVIRYLVTLPVALRRQHTRKGSSS